MKKDLKELVELAINASDQGIFLDYIDYFGWQAFLEKFDYFRDSDLSNEDFILWLGELLANKGGKKMKIELRIEQEFGEQFGGSWEYRLYAWMPREYLYLNSFESLEKAESAIKESLKNNFQSLAELLHYFNYGGEFKSDYFTPIEINP